MAITNISSAKIKEVSDRKVPSALDPECKRSALEGARGKGTNKQTMNESLADFNHAPEITE